MAVGLDYT